MNYKKYSNKISIISIILVTIMIFSFVSCGETTNKDAKDLKQVLSDSGESKAKPTQYIEEKNKITENNEELYNPNAAVLNLQEALRDIAKKSIPAVVNIRTEIKVSDSNNTFNFGYDDFFKKYFGTPENNEPKNQQALGSGFIISEDGYIVTNNHVVAGAVKVTVFLSDDREYDAKIIGTDEKTDTALLKIEADEKLPLLPMGDSNSIEVGDIAVAIGNPFGLNGTFTMGVISAKSRSESSIDKDATFKDYIQTDAPINQGNSGGPLLNIYGQVIGMNTAIISTSGGSIGLGFAVPINTVKKIVEDLADDGTVERPMLGLTVRDLDEDIAELYKIKVNEGAFVNEVVNNAPADIAGIKAMDIIIEIDGEKITNSEDVVRKVVSYGVGDKISVKILRLVNQTKIETKTIQVTLGLRDESKFENLGNSDNYKSPLDENGKTKEWLGMTLGNVSDYTDDNIGDINKGIVVLDIDKDSNAYKKDIRAGIVILSINGIDINNIDDLSKIKNNDMYMLRVYVNGSYGSVIIKE